ncbi:MAG: metal ABC transporter substrate-binding protein [Anaerolineae bacterium]|jgi:ABC-type Zn uptake system ZnuABC Zn-binding protein ZnuA
MNAIKNARPARFDRQRSPWPWLALLAVTFLAACGGTPAGSPAADPDDLAPVQLAPGQKLRVVATTNIVGDVVARVGGDQIDLVTLMGIGIDPHSYVPTPSDIAAIHDAHAVLINGADLEANIDSIFAGAGGDAVLLSVSRGLDLLPAPEGVHGDVEGVHGDVEGAHGDVGEEAEADPHVWFSVPNVVHWVDNIERTLSALDPDNAATYQENADAYVRELEELDAWIQDQVATIPPENRKLVTNHPVFGYLAAGYGFEQIGAIYPLSPSGEPSAQEIAALEDDIRRYGVPAIFAESSVNPKLAELIAQDTGVALVPLYTGSLGAPGSGAETYVQMMRYDVRAIVDALQ